MKENIKALHVVADRLAASLIQEFKDEMSRVLEQEPSLLMEDILTGNIQKTSLGLLAKRANEALSLAVELDNMIHAD